MGRKKPLDTIEGAHGSKWVVSAGGIRGLGDCVGTGGGDGWVRFWTTKGGEEGSKGGNKLEKVGSYFCDGFVNDLAIGDGGRFAVCAVGREHRRGRWSVWKGGKDGISIKVLGRDQKDDVEEEEVEHSGDED